MYLEQLDESAIPQIQIVGACTPGALQQENTVMVTTAMQDSLNEQPPVHNRRAFRILEIT